MCLACTLMSSPSPCPPLSPERSSSVPVVVPSPRSPPDVRPRTVPSSLHPPTVHAVRVFIRGPPKAVDDIVQTLFQDRSGGFCIDVGLIPQPEGDAVPDNQKLAIVVGDRSWIRYPPVRTTMN